MYDLPQRFVPTSSRFLSPVRIVVQGGHDSGISSLAVSPCRRFIAAGDCGGSVKVWCVETLDVLGGFRPGFVARGLRWDGGSRIVCTDGAGGEYVISFLEPGDDEDGDLPRGPIDPGRKIRLLDSPEVALEGDVIVVTRGGEESFGVTVEGLFSVLVDPHERYLVACAPSACVMYDIYGGGEMASFGAPEGGSVWVNAGLSERGDRIVMVSSDGTLRSADTIPSKSARKGTDNNWTAGGGVDLTASAFGGDVYAVLGDSRGNISVYELGAGRTVMRTPRLPRGFEAVYPSAGEFGFVALRGESATAFLAPSREILTAAPLPAPLVLSCPGNRPAEICVACADGVAYRMSLGAGTVSRCGRYEGEPDLMAASGTSGVLLHSAGAPYVMLSGGRGVELMDDVGGRPVSAAVSDDGTRAAVLFGDSLKVINVRSKAVSDVPLGGRTYGHIAFCGAGRGMTVLAFGAGTVSVFGLNGALRGEYDLGLGTGRVISVAPAGSGAREGVMAYVLTDGEHGQMLVYEIVRSPKGHKVSAELVLRVFAMGTQIWAASVSADTVNIRDDASCLRIISGMKAWFIDDWTRSEPLSLF